MKITITGSLGNISRPLSKELLNQGHSVTVISSKEDRRKDIEALGAKEAIGSMEDVAFLCEAFQGADIVYLMEPPFHIANPTADTETIWKNITRNYVKAILQTGITKVIHLSSIGAHTDRGVGILAVHYHVENILRELPDNISVKFMRPVGFYGNLLAYTEVIKNLSKGLVGLLMALQHYGIGGLLSGKRGVIVANYGGDTVNLMVSPIDIATVIADEMNKPFDGRTIRYIASEELTCNEVARTLGEAIGKPYLKWGKISDKMLTNIMIKRGMNERLAKGIVEMGIAGRNGKLYEDYYKHRPALGKTKLKDFAKTFAAAYFSS